MFTDIIGYTALMSRDEQKALKTLQKNREMQKSLAEKHNGEFLKEMGDGTLLCFQSALDAVRCAMEIQQSVTDDPDLNLRIGIHLGDIVFKEGDVFGDGVNVASRIEKLAEAGGICISGQVYKTIKNQRDVEVRLIGKKRLKNMEDPIEIYILTGTNLSESKISLNGRKSITISRNKRLLKILMSAVIVISLCVSGFLLWPVFISDRPVTEIDWQNSIAVLPFVDMSPERDQEFFCDGMAEEILNALTHIVRLRVIARTSAFAFKGKNMDVRHIGKKLGVETLLEGSVRKSGERLRVTVQLIRAADGVHLWSNQYDRNLTDVFTIQEEIALAIVDCLKIKLLGGEEERVTRRLTENLEAYHQYLRGRHILNRRKAEDIYTAISHFEKALELDSLYVMGYLGLADAYALLPSYAAAPAGDSYSKAKEYVNKVLEISEQVGEAYASLGWIRMLADWDWKGAEQAFQKGMELNPGYATLNHWYGYLYMMLREFDKALIKVKQALELDPLSPVINRVIGDVYYNSGEYEKAIPALEKCLELEPCLPFAHLQLSGCYSRKKLYTEALSEIQKEKGCRGNNYTGADYVEGIIYVRMGEMEKARQILQRLEALGEKSTGLSRLYFVLGEKEKGYQILEDMLDIHDTWITFINSNPDFYQVRHEERFKNLLRKIGFKP